MRETITLVIAGLFLYAVNASHACTYLGPRNAHDDTPNSWFRHSKSLYLGSIRTIEKADGYYVVHVAVTQTLKGVPHPLVQARRSGLVVSLCSAPIPETGSNVLVALGYLQQVDEVLPITDEYAKVMRKEWTKVQSNRTVEGDARKNGALPSP